MIINIEHRYLNIKYPWYLFISEYTLNIKHHSNPGYLMGFIQAEKMCKCLREVSGCRDPFFFFLHPEKLHR